MWRTGFFILIFALAGAARAEEAADFNLRTNPIGWVVGPNARLDFRVADPWTAGAGFNYVDRTLREVGMKGLTSQAFLTYSFAGAFQDGWFAELSGSYGDLRAQASDTGGAVYSRELHNTAGALMGGYHWFWSLLSISLGAGVYVNSAGGAVITDNTGTTVAKIPLPASGGMAELSFGILF